MEQLDNWLLHGAFERLNYGDLLFPILFARVLTKVFGVPPERIHASGMSGLDGGIYGGLPVAGLSDTLTDLCAQPRRFNFVGVGGETGNCDYYCGVSMLSPISLKPLLIPSVLRDAEASARHPLLRYPYIPDWTAAARPPNWIAYNAIGFSDALTSPNGLGALPELQQAHEISVRDALSYQSLQSHQLKGSLVPDSIVALAALCQLARDYLKEQFILRHPGFSLDSDYAALQINSPALEHYGVSGLRDLILKVNHETGLTPVLVPVGWAAFHEDHLVMRQLLADDAIAAVACGVADPNIWMTALLLSHARLFVGTSLHGRITALSYDLPRYSLNWGDQKVEAWVHTWEPNLSHTIISRVDDSFRFDLSSPSARGLGHELSLKYFEWLLATLTGDAAPLAHFRASLPTAEDALTVIGLTPEDFEGVALRTERLVSTPKLTTLEPQEEEIHLLRRSLHILQANQQLASEETQRLLHLNENLQEGIAQILDEIRL